MTDRKLSFAFNARLVGQQLRIAPRLTLAIIALVIVGVAVLAVKGAIPVGALTGALVGTLVGLAWVKGVVLLALYRPLYGQDYPGSFLVSTLVLNILLIIFFCFAFYSLLPLADPAYVRPPLWVMAFYALVILAIWGPLSTAAIYLQQKTGVQFKGFAYFRRQIGLKG